MVRATEDTKLTLRYVDIMLKLIMAAGENMADHVWYRCIKIITNQEDVQEYATMTLFRALQNPSCNKTVVKVGSYILGEYANLISDKPGSSAAIMPLILSTRL